MSDEKQVEREIKWLLSEKYRGMPSAGYEADVLRLVAGEHPAYVIGFVDFLGARINLSEHPLIPRAETEYWVREALNELASEQRTPSLCLDLFSGSGCIGISALKKFPGASIHFADIDPAMLRQAALNAELNGIDSNRFKIIASDGFSAISGKYQVIFANPPYLDRDKIDRAVFSALTAEPQHALFAEDSGLFHLKKTIELAPDFLFPGGVLYLEFDAPQIEALRGFADASNFRIADFRKDQYGEWRWARLALA